MDAFRSRRDPYPPGSRAAKPVEAMEVGEDPTTCHHCGSRTQLDSWFDDMRRRESCIHCRQRYDVEDEPDAAPDDPQQDLDGDDGASEEAWEERTPRYPDFGTF